jgi:tol-pal system protein YbgF
MSSSAPVENIVPSEFDPGHFWDQHKGKVLLYGGLLLVALLISVIYQVTEHRKLAASRAMLASATSAAEYAEVIEKFGGTMAAANAHLLLAASQREEGKFDEAIATLEDFLKAHPDHPLAGGALLSIGETQEAAGRGDEALATYQETAAKYPDSYGAPASLLAEAALLRNDGKTDEARRIYEDLISQFPESYMAQQAQQELRFLK